MARTSGLEEDLPLSSSLSAALLCEGNASAGGREGEHGHFIGTVMCINRRHMSLLERKNFCLLIFKGTKDSSRLTFNPPRAMQNC